MPSIASDKTCAAESRCHHSTALIIPDGGDEFQIIADRRIVGAHLRPLVADEHNPVCGCKGTFDVVDDLVVDIGGVSGAVIAFALCVRKEECSTWSLQGLAS